LEEEWLVPFDDAAVCSNPREAHVVSMVGEEVYYGVFEEFVVSSQEFGEQFLKLLINVFMGISEEIVARD
jgi:hypothetical protein